MTKPKFVDKSCETHGNTSFVLEGRGSYRCKKCRSVAVAKRRKKCKKILVAEFGGKCCVCGYNRYVGALDFHHLDPDTKSFCLAMGGCTRSLDKYREEARKCVLVCSNCHREVEAGVTQLPTAGSVNRVGRGAVNAEI